jgi:outer membrane protein TolC
MATKRRHGTRRRWLLAMLAALPSGGCLNSNLKIPVSGPHDTTASYYSPVATKIEYPDVENCMKPEARAALDPHSFEDPSQLPLWELSLEEAVRLGVGNSPIIRTIGGSVVNAPQGTSTVLDPAIQESSLGGVEAALAAFDAQWVGQLFWNKVDQPQNAVRFLSDNGTPNDPTDDRFAAAAFQATQANFNAVLSKFTATGARYSLSHNVDYNRANQLFAGLPFATPLPSVFTGFFEAEYRQPMMQGAGLEYNRIAGPNGGIGVYNGVLIARINNDISLTDFESSVIGLVNDIEQAYWDLYFAYRSLEAVTLGRESALQTWQFNEIKLQVGTGRQDEEAQARSQFFTFQVQVENALAGPNGVYALEQRLRYLLGQPATDGRLIKPTSEPPAVRVVFDWDSALDQAFERRVEIRRQKWQVKRRELELIAARLNRRPRLDFIGRYRYRGLGDHLIGPNDEDGLFADNLYASINDGNFQEWQAGLEMTFPVGLRAASSAVANAQLNLTRDRAILGEQELRISHDLSNAARQADRAYRLAQTNYNRWLADIRQLEVLRERYRKGSDNINFLLQAQRQLVTSQVEYYRSLTDYSLALRDIHREKGSLLAYDQVTLTEGPWPAGAQRDANLRGRFLKPHPHPEQVDVPAPVSRGPFDPSAPQSTGTGAMIEDSPGALPPSAPSPLDSLPNLDSTNAPVPMPPVDEVEGTGPGLLDELNSSGSGSP